MKVVDFKGGRLALFQCPDKPVNQSWYMFNYKGQMYGAWIHSPMDEVQEKQLTELAERTYDKLLELVP